MPTISHACLPVIKFLSLIKLWFNLVHKAWTSAMRQGFQSLSDSRTHRSTPIALLGDRVLLSVRRGLKSPSHS
ncbi:MULTISPECIES: hypothetical protein [unclassified Microcoleus]|uniref:hypothetical protein n=1 Tax=unclassified Microcoleus TaxID=2642155 RepID=UPI002FD0B678